MDDGRKDALIDEISQQMQDMYLAELIQVADFIKGLRAARKFMSAT